MPVVTLKIGPAMTATSVIESKPPSDPGDPESLRLRIRQQELLAQLGVLALHGVPLQELLDRTAAIVQEGLKAEFSKVLEYQAAENRFLVRAGVGWGPDVVGCATVGADLASPAGYALRTGKPVISNHLAAESRFRTPELLAENGVRRAMNVILQGDGVPFGVLEVDSCSPGEFNESDITFLQGAANLIGLAIERQRIERGLKQALERQKLLLQEVNHRVKNSLHLVSAMLDLQAQSVDDADAVAQLQEASGRIAAVARAHQRVHAGNGSQTVDLGACIQDVCAPLDDPATGCRVAVSVPQATDVNIDVAIPIALIVNELATNAAKHTGAGAKGCRIWVDVRRPSSQAIAITVRDDGSGLPAGFDPTQSKSLGMRIVTALANQLGAALSLQSGNPGAQFDLAVSLDRN